MVTFAGGGAGSGPLSWGQLDIWLKMTLLGQSLAMGGTRPLQPGTTLDDVAGELHYLMSRYGSMRTRLVFDGDGPPHQVVHGDGEIDLEVVDADDPEPEAARIEARYRDVPFDHVREWPVRMAVVRSGGVCRHAVLVMSHLVMDGVGAVQMMTETDARSTAPIEGHSALEQALRQASAAGVRQNAAALRHWDSHLRAMPAPVLAPSRDVREPRHWTGVFSSTVLPSALREAALRAGVEPAPALLAAFAIAFAEVTGVAVLPLRLISSNRFRAGFGGVVAPVSQMGLCVIDTAGGFTDVLHRVRPAAITAYKYAYYNRLDLDAVLAAVVADQGQPFDLDVSLNDRRLGGALQDVPRPERSEFTWIASGDEPSSALFLNVDGSDEAVAITMYVDSHLMAPADAEAILWAMERVAVLAPGHVEERVPAPTSS